MLAEKMFALPHEIKHSAVSNDKYMSKATLHKIMENKTREAPVMHNGVSGGGRCVQYIWNDSTFIS